jgi:hypothetical protein
MLETEKGFNFVPEIIIFSLYGWRVFRMLKTFLLREILV